MRVNEYDPWNWQLVQTLSAGKIKVYANDYMVSVIVEGTFSINQTTTTLATLNSIYAPPSSNLQMLAHQSRTDVVVIANTNEVLYIKYSSITSHPTHCVFTYPRKSALD